MMKGYGDKSGLAEEEVMIAAIPKNKAEGLSFMGSVGHCNFISLQLERLY